MNTSVEVLSNTVYINHNGVELGIPKEAMEVAMQHPKLQKEGCDLKSDGIGLGYMQPMSCPSCGLVPTSTGTCGYCGSKCD